MPKPCPKEFREDVVRVARNREPGVTLEQIAADFGVLLDEARVAGEAMAERTAWRICRDNGWWSASGERRGREKNAESGPPVHDDLVRRDFTADGPNRLWLTDITEHATGEGRLCLCVVRDVYCGRIVGCSSDARMSPASR
ncbi:hypothetical protein QCN29_33685 [Streptomyces sp. HNM0663]|uniref:Transposase n=1 Tax=Streptomyces chengmaiensis TaxID=3040919 RepID=A0ABT6HY44_9ACTN|nr:hypothetical protein [Streptomyces chengmaiensis]MDH2393629.1 hypothetical protein [Streptomyces chengmaiensis]